MPFAIRLQRLFLYVVLVLRNTGDRILAMLGMLFVGMFRRLLEMWRKRLHSY